MSALVQISDPHFGTERVHVVEALREFIRGLGPALVVLSGDITQRARRRQFEAAARFMSELAAPRVVAIPGNHDIPLFNLIARVFHPYANYVRAFGDDLEPEYDSDHLLVLGVNTTRPRRRKDGEVSEVQVQRVAARLRAARPGQLRIVVTHQPLHVIRKQDIANLLHGHESAVRAWSAAGADILMGGHIHLPYIRPLSERFHDLPRDLWTVQAGTAVSWRVRDGAPNSINVIRYPLPEPGACSAERWDYDYAANSFQRVAAVQISLDRRP